MLINVNGCKLDIAAGTDLAQLRMQFKPEADTIRVNGMSAPPEHTLHEGDQVSLMCSEQGYAAARFDAMLAARHGEHVQRTLQQACVAIAGAGGLGSNVAIFLARAGVGSLIIADHDQVELSNIQRQQYFIDQIGQPKVHALGATLQRINPALELKLHLTRVDGGNAPDLFSAASILVEAFDLASAKAELAQSWMQHFPQRPLVSGSGMAGFAPANSISTRHPFANLYLCGDGSSAVESVGSLCASRVGIAASHQAHAVVRLLLGLDPLHSDAEEHPGTSIPERSPHPGEHKHAIDG